MKRAPLQRPFTLVGSPVLSSLTLENSTMAKHRVLLIGATGETGGDILDGLVEDGSFVRTIP